MKLATPHGTTAQDPAAGWWRAHSAALALLRHACAQADAAEKTIIAQEARIRELEALAATDAQTGLMNRRGFEAHFARERARMQRRQDAPGAVLVLIDLDGFKPVNDRHGHLAGDACLRAVARLLTGFARGMDAAARFGGDEFALLLCDTTPARAAARLARLRAALSDMAVCWQEGKLRLSASMGVAAVTAQCSLDAAYAAADKALYARKAERQDAGGSRPASTPF